MPSTCVGWLLLRRKPYWVRQTAARVLSWRLIRPLAWRFSCRNTVEVELEEAELREAVEAIPQADLPVEALLAEAVTAQHPGRSADLRGAAQFQDRAEARG